MNASARTINPHISVDCVIFGFSTNQLKVLLIEREFTNKWQVKVKDLKLPGDFISINEDLDIAASRTLKELTGLQNIFLQQFAFVGQPDRISRKEDVKWLNETTGMKIHRVVTAAYFALINIPERKMEFAIKNNARWIDIQKIPPWHSTILKLLTKDCTIFKKH